MRSRLVLPILLAVLTAATPSDDGKVRETVQRMRVIAEAIRLYSTDVSDIPRATSMRELEARLVPRYVRSIPLTDAWGNEMRYSAAGSSYRLAAHDVVVEDGYFTTLLPASVMVPPRPFEAPLAQPTGESPMIRPLTARINADLCKQTMRDIRTIALAVEMYATAQNHYPPARTISDLRPYVEPKYTPKLPLLDAWQVPYRYTTSADGQRYTIRSGGADLSIASNDEPAATDETTSDASADAIYRDGRFVRSWDIKPDPAVQRKAIEDALAARLQSGESAASIRADLQEAKEISQRLRTLVDMHLISTALVAYNNDERHYPAAKTIDELARLLEPKYIRNMPRTDAWGTPFRYVAASTAPHTFVLASAGSDKEFDEKSWSVRGTFDDSRADAVVTPDGMARRWKAPLNWSVDIVQNGQSVPEVNGVVALRRAPFTIRVTLPRVTAVMINALADDRVSRRIKGGFDFSECAKDIVAFCPATGLAEGDGNADKRLVLSAEAMQYVTEERWNRTAPTADGVVLERDVVRIDDTPVEKTRLDEVYLVLVVRDGSATVLQPHEIRRARLHFR